jgi:hypothetical protein
MNQQEEMRDFHFPPVVNGIDYLSSVIDLLLSHEENPNPRNMKYVILHLHAAVEVLLKHRLQQEDWELVVENLEETSHNDFLAANFRSISLTQTIKTLKNDFGVRITKGEKVGIERLSKSRNAVQHWGNVDSTTVLESQSVKVLDFLIRFLDEELLEDPEDESLDSIKLELEKIKEGKNRIKLFIDRRMSRINQTLKKADFAIPQCPKCTQTALPIDPNELKCLFCAETWNEAEDLLDDYFTNILDFSMQDVSKGADDPKRTCPQCNDEMLIQSIQIYGTKKPADVCFRCGEYFIDWEECIRCGKVYKPIEKEVACMDCIIGG